MIYRKLAAAAAITLATLAAAAAQAEVRWIINAQNQLRVTFEDDDGLQGYVIRSPDRNGAVEATDTLADCPQTATEVMGAPHPTHAHWFFWTTCEGRQLMVQADSNTRAENAEDGDPYTPPRPEDAIFMQGADARLDRLSERLAMVQWRARVGLALGFAALLAGGVLAVRQNRAQARETRPRG